MSLELSDRTLGLYIRLLEPEDASALLQLRVNSREANQAFEPRYPNEFFTLPSQLDLIYRRQQEAWEDKAYLFGLFSSEDHELRGTLSLTHLVRGVGQFADIGYSMDSSFQGKGYMTGGVKLLLAYAFRSLGLHRVQAGILPHNIASRRVLEKCGFQAEGIARKLVKINDQWEDHQMFSILEEEFTRLSTDSTADTSTL
ncbi:GNAT family protein [Paenibacillus sp. PsM32]|uniref:GNAT family N-acetyltransferase n=1 Tax=Paenibacillus sp. PsM32 TaxID=3030536 RepID=UPI00263B2CDC|nr:GNAT family protein [Paenibacillus sp. PsM32]MDN4620864.1 GNAT family protein [Paenibacillus sp. PsM32]